MVQAYLVSRVRYCNKPKIQVNKALPQQSFKRKVLRRRFITTRESYKNDDDLLKGVPQDTRAVVQQVLYKGLNAAENWTTVATDFLSPPECQDALMVLKKLTDVGALNWGGYPQAERQQIFVGREDIIDGLSDENFQDIFDNMVVVEVRGNFMFDAANHRDFLGACLGCGIDRSKIGDVLVQGERGAQIIMTSDISRFIQAELTMVRSVPVYLSVLRWNELIVPEVRSKDITCVEHSKRLDAIASAGFRVSRSAMTDLIKGGDVKLNWRQVEKPSVEIDIGDVISCRGKGKMNVISIQQNKKGKFVVQVQVLI
eukprot:TRINITY_DN3353_c0_g1_i1.p1 TRINITY_DN3353_c0_g1~~TRINITY_DN3353_c0_g1_i1.p1  ORF type:complete len:337 (+),score=22.40 TRINITY_DN3353_c0_g1_i1:73-1011(+)